jgi:Periplasmic binding protein
MTDNQAPNGGSDQIDRRIKGLVDLSKSIIRDQRDLVVHGRWFTLSCSFVFLVFILFAPARGVLYPTMEKLMEGNELIKSSHYNSIFIGVILFTLLVGLILQIINTIRRSGKRLRLFLFILTLLLVFIGFNLLFTGFNALSGELNDRLSTGEKTLFNRRSPEFIVYDSNRRSISRAKNPFNRPFKVAISLPISWINGTNNSQEVLRGVAIAQREWNDEHVDTQITVIIADDGYDKFEDESKRAVNIAEDLVKDNDVLGVIGHFSSGATDDTADIYKDKQVILISPTSTSKRCGSTSSVSKQDSSSNCLDFNEYVFRTALNEDTIITNFLNYIQRKPYKSVIAILYEGRDDYSRLYKETFLEKAKGSGVKVIDLLGNKTGLRTGLPTSCSTYATSKYRFHNPAAINISWSSKSGTRLRYTAATDP